MSPVEKGCALGLSLIVSGCCGAVALLTLIVPLPPLDPDDPYRYCVGAGSTGERLDCYLYGDVPEGETIVWHGPQSSVPDRRHEDMPGWDCSTMGNEKCNEKGINQ